MFNNLAILDICIEILKVIKQRYLRSFIAGLYMFTHQEKETQEESSFVYSHKAALNVNHIKDVPNR